MDMRVHPQDCAICRTGKMWMIHRDKDGKERGVCRDCARALADKQLDVREENPNDRT